MKTPFLTPKHAEAWRAAQRTVSPAELPAPSIGQGAFKIGLVTIGTAAFAALGWLLSYWR